MEELIKNIEQWADDKGIVSGGTYQGQIIKTAEELSELIKGMCKNDIEMIKDSVGDVFVTLVVGNLLYNKLDFNTLINENVPFYTGLKITEVLILIICKNISKIISNSYQSDIIQDIIQTLIYVVQKYDLTLEECVQSAYNEIKDRKGKMIDGQFVKESDLKEDGR